jgi:hypothetical protein
LEGIPTCGGRNGGQAEERAGKIIRVRTIFVPPVGRGESLVPRIVRMRTILYEGR